MAESVTEINIAYPEATDRHLKIAVGACRLKIVPGAGEAWVAGSYRDPSGALPCRIVQEGGYVKITQSREGMDVFGWLQSVPAFELALGTAKPYALTLETGASESDLDLGGAPISRLTIKQGAGKLAVDFSAPNPEAMGSLELSSGAGAVELRSLANARFAEMRVDGGAAGYRFDFGGTLRRDARVKITTGVSGVEVYVPAATAAKITSTTILGGTDVGDGFTRREGAFWTPAALAGAGPILTIEASVTLGGLRLRML